MIDHKMLKGNVRVCFYKGKYRPVSELSKLPECIISRPTLTQRLNQAITNPKRSRWESVHECLVTKTIMGRPGGSVRQKPPKKVFIESDFIKLMMMMPVHNSNEEKYSE